MSLKQNPVDYVIYYCLNIMMYTAKISLVYILLQEFLIYCGGL